MPIWDVPDIDEFYPEDKGSIEDEQEEGWNEDGDLDFIDEIDNDEPTEEDLKQLGIKP